MAHRATAMEYGIIAALIAVVLIAVLGMFSDNLSKPKPAPATTSILDTSAAG